MKKILYAIAGMLFATSALLATDVKRTKYVFLFIGDGMSLPQRMATDDFLKAENRPALAMNQMNVCGITKTSSADSLITDSAASGTAIACGRKVPNHYVGVDADGNKLTSCAVIAKNAGKKVGIITSVTLNHATPASFYAHTPNRSNYYKIGLDLAESNFDFFGGGNVNAHDNKKAPEYRGDALDIAAENGYKVVKTAKEISALKKGDGKVLAIAETDGAIPYIIDAPDSMRIRHLLEKAIELLDNDNGFFIMIEGGKIDWMCHANDAATTINETVDLDNAIKVALDFAKKHPAETLVVVTGDHETGGLTLGFAGTGYKSYFELLKNQKCSSNAFEEKLAKLFKANPDAQFADAQKLLSENFGFKFGGKKSDRMTVKKHELKTLKTAFEREKSEHAAAASDLSYERKRSPLTVAAIRLLNNKAGIAWTSNAHTALPVNTSATGVNEKMFSGMYENTEISVRLKEILAK